MTTMYIVTVNFVIFMSNYLIVKRKFLGSAHLMVCLYIYDNSQDEYKLWNYNSDFILLRNVVIMMKYV